jgi:hypothetical protein
MSKAIDFNFSKEKLRVPHRPDVDLLESKTRPHLSAFLKEHLPNVPRSRADELIEAAATSGTQQMVKDGEFLDLVATALSFVSPSFSLSHTTPARPRSA